MARVGRQALASGPYRSNWIDETHSILVKITGEACEESEAVLYDFLINLLNNEALDSSHLVSLDMDSSEYLARLG